MIKKYISNILGYNIYYVAKVYNISGEQNVGVRNGTNVRKKR